MLKNIKHQFFARRNGIVADALRKGGEDYKTIFGLQVPDIAAISRTLTQDTALADALWADTEVRESRLLACYIFPPAEVDFNKALKLAREVRNREEADMLGFRLMKRLAFATDVADTLRTDPDPLMQYMALAIARHLPA
ncbi:MAG: DNA alkylation repair protein [Muribaculaceae bacterium]|nr:DNA alkylation repair protein [Muribaculaceae bacterium]